MKRILLITIITMLPFGHVIAQDIITLKNGIDIQAKILEITPEELKYKKYSNQEGPIITIKKSDILIIRYENGENEVFTNESSQNGKSSYKANTAQPIKRGMRYSEYKNFYDERQYVHQIGDPYGTGWAGVASFFIPGLGQGIADEWGRGAWIFAVNLGLGVVTILSTPTFKNYITYTNQPFPFTFFVSTIGRLTFDVWSIVDAVKVAKIKNMYIQDVHGKQLARIDYSIVPFMTMAQLNSSERTAITGLSVNLSF